VKPGTAATARKTARKVTRKVTRGVKKQAGRLSGMLPDMPHLGVDPIVVVKGMRRAIRRVRARLP
jgi:hypothetical protein